MTLQQRPPDFGECPVCGTRTMPVLDLPPCGHNRPLIVRPLDTEGVVYSWTRLWTSTESNVLLVMADFLNGTLRAAAPLTGADSIAIGDTVIARVGVETPLSFTVPSSPAARKEQ